MRRYRAGRRGGIVTEGSGRPGSILLNRAPFGKLRAATDSLVKPNLVLPFEAHYTVEHSSQNTAPFGYLSTSLSFSRLAQPVGAIFGYAHDRWWLNIAVVTGEIELTAQWLKERAPVDYLAPLKDKRPIFPGDTLSRETRCCEVSCRNESLVSMPLRASQCLPVLSHTAIWCSPPYRMAAGLNSRTV